METAESVCKTKTRYPSERIAIEDIERIKKKSDRPVVPQRPYYCTVCSFWHLTSKMSRSDIAKDKAIASLQAQVEELTLKLNTATKQLNALVKATNKEDRVSVKADERVKQLTEKSNSLGKLVQSLRKDNSELITKNLSLERRLNEQNGTRQ